MKKKCVNYPKDSYKIIVVDDDLNIINSLNSHFSLSYEFTTITNPIESIDLVKNNHFDLMILNSTINSINTTTVIEEIRKFNKELYILLLTNCSNSLPSIDLIRELDIQGFYEKNNNFNQLILLIESSIKAINQMNLIKRINNELKDTYNELEKSYIESIEILRFTVEAKDFYTRGHSDRVSEYSVLIGKYMNLTNNNIEILRVGGLFHDIGKIGVPDDILLKSDKLTSKEYDKIKCHPIIGAHILSKTSIFKNLIPIVEHHHERYDGNGYPYQLNGNVIPILARITAVADAFDAMTSKRIYRDAISLDSVKLEIRNCKGTQFDPIIADVFLNIIENHYNEILEIQNRYK